MYVMPDTCVGRFELRGGGFSSLRFLLPKLVLMYWLAHSFVKFLPMVLQEYLHGDHLYSDTWKVSSTTSILFLS